MGWFNKTSEPEDDIVLSYNLEQVRRRLKELREIRDDIDKLKGVTLDLEQRYNLVKKLMEIKPYGQWPVLTEDAKARAIAIALAEDELPYDMGLTAVGGIQIHYRHRNDEGHKMITIDGEGNIR